MPVCVCTGGRGKVASFLRKYLWWNQHTRELISARKRPHKSEDSRRLRKVEVIFMWSLRTLYLSCGGAYVPCSYSYVR